MTNRFIHELLQLSVAERMQLAEDLWDSVANDTAQLPVPETQRTELERRLSRFAENPCRHAPVGKKSVESCRTAESFASPPRSADIVPEVTQ